MRVNEEELPRSLDEMAEALGLNEEQWETVCGLRVRLTRVIEFTGDAWVIAVGDLKEALAADIMRLALETVQAAMLNGGDGAEGDFGWNITALNAARPLIRAALQSTEIAHE